MLELHSLVKATDEGYGEYIGEVVGFRNHPASVYYVKILACTKYPSQYALLVKEGHFKREPYLYLSKIIFSFSNVQIYNGDVPEYEHSVKVAYEQAQETCCV